MMKRSVLIVEDEAIVAEDLRTMLGNAGLQVIGIARSGAEALDEITRGKPDLVIMDLQLGGNIQGNVIASRIIEKEEIVPKFLFITGLNIKDGELQEKGRSLVLRKPYLSHELFHAISMLFQAH